MTMTNRAMMVLPDHAPLARSLAAAFEPTSGAGMFVTPVYDHDGVIRYYASNGAVQEPYAELLDDATGDKLWAAVQAAKAPIPEASIRAMMAGAIVRTDCNVLDLVAELGLYGHNDPKGDA